MRDDRPPRGQPPWETDSHPGWRSIPLPLARPVRSFFYKEIVLILALKIPEGDSFKMINDKNSLLGELNITKKGVVCQSKKKNHKIWGVFSSPPGENLTGSFC